MSEKETIREIREGDVSSVLSLTSEVFSGQEYFAAKRSREFWNWKYERNVFGIPIQIVATAGDELIGFRSFWPWELVCRGQQVKAYQPVDTVVHPDYQGRGLFTKMTIKAVRKAIDESADLLFNFPNQNSLPGNLKLGWKYIGRLPWLIKPLRPFHLLTNLRIRERASPVEIDNKYTITDELLHRMVERDSFDSLLRTRQSPGFFEWRYKLNPFLKYGAFQMTKGSKRLSAVFEVNQKGPRREMIIVDILGSSDLTKELFKALIDIARSMNVDFITTIMTSGYSMSSLKSLGFLRMKRKNLVALPLNLALEGIATRMENWRIVGGMHDSL